MSKIPIIAVDQAETVKADFGCPLLVDMKRTRKKPNKNRVPNKSEV